MDRKRSMNVMQMPQPRASYPSYPPAGTQSYVVATREDAVHGTLYDYPIVGLERASAFPAMLGGTYDLPRKPPQPDKPRLAALARMASLVQAIPQRLDEPRRPGNTALQFYLDDLNRHVLPTSLGMVEERQRSSEILNLQLQSDSNARMPRGKAIVPVPSSKVPSGTFPSAHGGFSDIWRCLLRQGSQNIEVAVKAIRPYACDEADTYKKNKRLRRELKVWARLHHKNIWPLLGVTSGFGPFIAMVCPWATNGTLTSYLERYHHQLTTRDRFLLLSDVAEGLGYLHSQSVAHGDLTGTNILLDGNGVAYVADFGLSTMLADFMGASNFTSSTRGNVRWAAPELFGVRGSGTASPMPPSMLSDIYSFGCVMFQVLSGQVPYHDLRNDRQVLVKMMVGITPRRPVAFPIIEDEHWDFIRQCWAPLDTRRRPSSEDIIKFLARATPLR
ncbi:hypothetical protein HYDPIDRAFT_25549 [Hydnomerulius pinastri MD-312]|nr:hypothetical protein HYDPIDRAFT_25549 [Hydnomerulius pinastri MD-312]